MVKISIISVNYNNATGLYKTIQSVLSQTIKQLEFIIIDGGSSDGSKELIEQNKEKVNYWVSEKDKGIYHAMNKGIKKASGTYLLFLNSGDCLSAADVLQKCCNAIDQNPDGDIYYGDMYLVNDPNHPYRHLCHHPNSLSLDYLKADTINHQSSFIKASLFREIGLYPEQYKLASDYWLFLQCFLHNKEFRHLAFPVADYDFSGASSTNQRLYQEEKRDIWQSLVPQAVQNLLQEAEGYRQLKQYKIVKAAIWLNNNYQALKKNNSGR